MSEKASKTYAAKTVQAKSRKMTATLHENKNVKQFSSFKCLQFT